MPLNKEHVITLIEDVAFAQYNKRPLTDNHSYECGKADGVRNIVEELRCHVTNSSSGNDCVPTDANYSNTTINSGSITLGDMTLEWTEQDDCICYTAKDSVSNDSEQVAVYNKPSFYVALSVFTHPDGAFDIYSDNNAGILYRHLEAIMPNNQDLRWIP
jgi:hypothetical protein